MKSKRSINIYISLLFIVAISIYIYLLSEFVITDYAKLMFWIILAIVAETLLIQLPNNRVGVSVGFAISLAAIIVGGPLIGATVSSLGLLFRFPRISDKGIVHLFNTPPYKTIFNVSQSIILSSAMGIIYLSIGGAIGEFVLFPTLVIIVLDVVLNTTIISVFLTLTSENRFFYIWLNNIRGMFASALAVGCMGIIVALAFIGYGYAAVLLFFAPLLLARYSFRLYIEMRNVYLSTIDALNKAIEAKDPYTSGHASRVEELAVHLAQLYNLPFEKIENIKNAAILHDIGKIGVSDQILHKASKLSQEEYASIMRHPAIGANIISKVDFLKDISHIIKHHHERYDGKGYPDGLVGKDIPIEASILMIADSYDAMTSDRPYRRALTKKEALEEIRINSGTQFHPQLAETFIKMMNYEE